MGMGTPEEAMAANNNNEDGDYAQVIVKRKRTKRQRLLQLPSPAVTATSSTSSSSTEFSGSTTEEEDMANCLVLLAQGRALDGGRNLESPLEEEVGGGGGSEKSTRRRLTDAATTTKGKAGVYVYECKTCNKCFPSFQALGGHRASHKKPKTTPVAASTGEKKAVDDDSDLQISMASTINARNSNNNNTTTATKGNNNNTNYNSKSRVHECSICGSEFSSGQALGGHMRRHRAAIVHESQAVVIKKEKSILLLDLNLPAPTDDDCSDLPTSPSSFTFASEQLLMFSAPALVDCHY